MDDSTPWPIREAERLWRFISDSVGPTWTTRKSL